MKNQIIEEIIDKVKNKIDDIDNPDMKYINISMYDSSQFNAENLVKLIQTENNESFSKEKLIENLNLMSTNIKSQIYEQVKDHYPIFISLCNKLQNIDCMVDNIEKPLDSMKIKLMQEIDFTKSLKDNLILSKNALTKIYSEIILLELSIRIDSLFNEIKKEIENYDVLNSERVSKFSNEDIISNYNNLKLILNNLLFTAGKIEEFNKLFNKAKSLYEVDCVIKFNENEEFSNDLGQYYNVIYKQYLRIKEEEERIVSFLQNILISLLNLYLKTKKRALILNIKRNTSSYFSNSEMKDTKSVTTKTTSKTNNDYKIIKSVSQYEVIIIKLISILNILGQDQQIYLAFNKNQILNNLVSETMDLVENSLKSKIIILIREYIALFGDLIDNLKQRNLSTINISLNSFLTLVCQKISTDKSLFNCTDINSFYDNYSSIVLLIHSVINDNLKELNNQYMSNKNNVSHVMCNYMTKYIDKYSSTYKDLHSSLSHEVKNFEKSNCLKLIVTCIQKYSFFTYFQLIQADINKVLIEYFNTDTNSNVNKKSYINNSSSNRSIVFKDLSFKSNFASKLMNLTNFLFSLNKAINEQLNGNRVFTKIIPNMLNFKSTLNNYVISLISIFLTSEEINAFCFAVKDWIKFYSKVDNELNQFSFNEFEMSSIKELIIMFLHNICEYYSIMTVKFKSSLKRMITLESHIYLLEVS